MKPNCMKPNCMKSVAAKIAILSAITLSLALAGCGQKGNLYLPNQKKKVPSTQTAPAQTPPATQTPAAPEQSSGAK